MLLTLKHNVLTQPTYYLKTKFAKSTFEKSAFYIMYMSQIQL